MKDIFFMDRAGVLATTGGYKYRNVNDFVIGIVSMAVVDIHVKLS